jgi:hypothetical protein
VRFDLTNREISDIDPSSSAAATTSRKCKSGNAAGIVANHDRIDAEDW